MPFVTADDLMRMPDDTGYTYELEQGRVTAMPKPGVRHGLVGSRLFAPLARFVDEHGLGAVLPQDTGFLLARNPDTVRGPDLAFVSRRRFASMASMEGFLPGAPDLAVEVRSPNDRWSKLLEKADEYLRYGARLVWIIDPRRQEVAVIQHGAEPVTLKRSDVLDGGTVIPGFRLPVQSLFDFDELRRPA